MIIKNLKSWGLNKFFCLKVLISMLFASPAHTLDNHFIEGYVYIAAVQEISQDWMVEVSLLDVSKMDVASEVISQTVISTGSENPFAFYLAYDLSKLRNHFRYTLKARISDASGKLIAINDQQHLFDAEIVPVEYDILTRGIKRVNQNSEQNPDQNPEIKSLKCGASVYRAKIYSGFIVLESVDNRNVKIFIQAPAASGVRYVRGDRMLWMKGHEGFYEKPGYQKQSCRID